jgi:predicted branched-subunit amino acid permease
MKNNTNAKTASPFLAGLRDGVPIALGYFAVAFSLGIAARNAGLTAFQGFFASMLCVASAGEYALFTLIGAGATYLEVAVLTLITNARYFLMSCALSQRISPDMKNYHRYLIGAVVTDEIFGITIARPGYVEPAYNYGAIAVSVPAWAIGTALGILMGNLLPLRVVSALSVALYGMFLAIIIPPAKKSLAVALCVVLGFACSWLCGAVDALAAVSAGTRTILLTVLLSAGAALVFPVKEAGEDAQ